MRILEDGLPEVPGYRIEKEVGRGGSKIVYKAFKQLGTEEYPCALKVYRNSALTSHGLNELRIRRDKLKGGDGSEFIEQLYHFDCLPDGRLFLETDFIEGDAIVKKEFKTNSDGTTECVSETFSRTLSPIDAVSVALKVASGLEYLHGEGYVTGDLNLNNIMVNDGLSVVRICDLDNTAEIGKHLRPRKRYDGSFGLVGRRSLPPEVLAKEQEIIEGRSEYIVNAGLDTYALGTCLLHLFRGCMGGLEVGHWKREDFIKEMERSRSEIEELKRVNIEFYSTVINFRKFLYRHKGLDVGYLEREAAERRSKDEKLIEMLESRCPNQEDIGQFKQASDAEIEDFRRSIYEQQLEDLISEGLGRKGIDCPETIGLTDFLKKALSYDPNDRYKTVRELRRDLEFVEKNFRFSTRYKGPRILGRLNNTKFIYGKVKEVKKDPNGSSDSIYEFENILFFEAFIGHSLDTDQNVGENLVEAFKKQNGREGIVLNSRYFLHRSNPPQQNIRRRTYPNGRIILQPNSPDSIIIPPNVAEATGTDYNVWRVRSSIPQLIEFDFDDNVFIYNEEPDFMENVINAPDDQRVELMGDDRLPPPLEESRKYSALEDSKWIPINQLLERPTSSRLSQT